jgi:hypothetical protein
MKTKWIIGWLALLVLAVAARAEDWKCAVCGKPIVDECRLVVDEVTGLTNRVCLDCAKLDRCSVCGMPVKTGFMRLPDGRILCAREAAAAVCGEEEAKDICHNAHDDIDRLFSRYMDFPGNDVEVSVVDKFHLQNLFFAPGFQKACVTVNGATASNPLGNGKFLHTIDLLSCMSKPHLLAVSAHEYTHAWMAENVKPNRVAGMDRDTVEAFCELVAYKYMASRNETAEMDAIKRNTYTKGKIAVLLAADSQYGFNDVLEWVKSGEDDRLDLARLDRIRAVQGEPYAPQFSPATLWKFNPTPAPAAVPDTLQLKGISGPPQHRFAIINDGTFEPMEKALVRVGQTNVSLRCLEIREDSVIIQVNGASHTQQLFLSHAP